MELSYHMRGSPGSLIVSAGERGSTYTQIMSIDGSQGDEWHTTRFNIPQYLDAVVGCFVVIFSVKYRFNRVNFRHRTCLLKGTSSSYIGGIRHTTCL